MSLRPQQPFSLWAYLEAPCSCPGGGSGIPSVLFPFSGLDQVGGEPMQDLLWEWEHLRTHQPPALACMGLGAGASST